jgi:hypothetical protein
MSRTDGSSPQTISIDSKGNYGIQLTAPPNTNVDHDIETYFTAAAISEYKSSESPITKLTVQGGTGATLTAVLSTETLLSLKVNEKDKMTGGAEYTVSDKLVKGNFFNFCLLFSANF